MCKVENPSLKSSIPVTWPKLIQRTWGHLSRRRKRQCGLLLGLMFICAFAEVISLGAVLPFLGVLTNPERVYNHPIVAGLSLRLGISAAEQLLLPITVVFIVAVLLSGAVRLFQLWAIQRFSYATGHDLSNAAYLRTLYQPYKTHLGRNSSEVLSGIEKVEQLMALIIQMMGLISAIALTVFIVLTLVVVNTRAAIFAFLGFGIAYGLVTGLARRRLQSNSQKIAKLQPLRVKAVLEGLGAIRDVLLGGHQQAYSDIYRNADIPWRVAVGNTNFIGDSPRYAVEALGIVLIALISYGLSQQKGGATAVILTLGALAFGAQRLLPALQQIFRSWSSMAGSRASMEDALNFLDQPLPEEALAQPPLPLEFQKNVCFESVRFKYSNEGPLVLDGLELTIPHGSRIGFVGCTGSGKSTLLDLFMGLIVPTLGRITVDGLPLHGERLRAWQRNIAHVPQNIFLADSTFAGNIAFGLPLEEIDMDRVRKAARQAHIAEFIESNPGGYDVLVGERGIRLSGGQRQRIGIARALYGKASVLVFDEATSALDNTTERAVMEAIDGLGRDLTILTIAHRLTTVSMCDMIVQLEHGKIAAQGTFEQLLAQSPTFRSMAEINDHPLNNEFNI